MAAYGVQTKRKKRGGGTRDESEIYLNYSLFELMDLLRRNERKCRIFAREERIKKRRQTQNLHDNG